MEKSFFLFSRTRLSMALWSCALFISAESHGYSPDGKCSHIQAAGWVCYVKLRSGSTSPHIASTCDAARSEALNYCTRAGNCVPGITLDPCPRPQAAVVSSRPALTYPVPPVLTRLSQGVGGVSHAACQGSVSGADLESIKNDLILALGISQIEHEADQRNEEIFAASNRTDIETPLTQASYFLLLDGQQGDSYAFLQDAKAYFSAVGRRYSERGGVIINQRSSGSFRDSVVFANTASGPVMMTGRRFLSTPRVAGETPAAIRNLTVFRERNFRSGSETLKVRYNKNGVDKVTDLNGLASDWQESRCTQQVRRLTATLPPPVLNWQSNVPVIAVSGRRDSREGWVEIDESRIPKNISVDERLQLIHQQYAEKLGSSSAYRAE